MYKVIQIIVITGLLAFHLACKNTILVRPVSVKSTEVTLTDSLYYYQGRLVTGIIVDDSPSSPLIAKEEISIVEGRMDGPYRQWMKGDVLRTEKNYKAGVEEGLQKGYHVDGKLSYEYYSVSGKKTGAYKEYYPNGLLHIELQYEKGEMIGKKILDQNGVTLTNYIIRDGRYYGLLGSNGCINVLNENDEIEN